jgi:hypothetical protein
LPSDRERLGQGIPDSGRGQQPLNRLNKNQVGRARTVGCPGGSRLDREFAAIDLNGRLEIACGVRGCQIAAPLGHPFDQRQNQLIRISLGECRFLRMEGRSARQQEQTDSDQRTDHK